jgi:hypothetical protein
VNPQRISSEKTQPLPTAETHPAKPYSIQSKLLAIGLFTASIGGTFAIFGCVPLMARFISPSHQPVPRQIQAFPDTQTSPNVVRSEPALPSPNQQARAIFSGDQRTDSPLSSRSSL